MKIVIVTDFYYPSIGGVEIETHRLARELSRLGHNIYVITPFWGGNKSRYKDGKIKVIGIKSVFRLFTPDFLIKNKLFSELKKISPDVIHIQSNLFLSRVAGLYAKNSGTACIATGHYAKGEIEFNFRKVKPIAWFVGHAIDIFYKKVWKNADIVTAPSEYANKIFQKLIKDDKKIITVSNGIYTNEYSRVSKNRPNIKKILYVGRFVASKNVEMLIKSFAKVLLNVNSQLILVGGGAEENNLRNLVKNLGIEKKVIFTGFITESKVKEIYRRSDVFVTASGADNQPLTILEALASGLPVVASNIGGIPELIKHGKNGLLFKTNNVDSLTKNLLKILLNNKLRKQMSKEAIKTAGEHNISETVIKMQNLYQKAIAINNLKNKNVQVIPFYLTRKFAIRAAFAMFLMGFLFRNLLVSPTLAKAKTLIVMKIENIDLRLIKK